MKDWIKAIITTSLIFLNFTVQASQDIPSTARLLTQLYGQVSFNVRNAHKSDVTSIGDAKIAAYETQNNEQYAMCSELIFQWMTKKYCPEGSGMCFFQGINTVVDFTINVYCVPRPESQKFIMSVELACEKNPTVECVKLAPQFDQIVPTTSRNVGRP